MTRGSGRGRRRITARLLVAIAALAVAWNGADAQATRAPAVPWAVGEYLEYSLKFGAFSAGSGRMQVLPKDTVRERNAWRFRFDFSGGISWLGLNIKDIFDSWLDAETLHSLKFEQHLSEIGKNRTRIYQIFPDRLKFKLNNEDERESVADPLDDASIFFFIRTIPLEVGKSYDFNRYFDKRSNPVTIRVLRRDTVSVPAGTFPAIVIQPMIKTSGIFSDGGQAELWLSDDDRRILLQMHAKLSFGSLNLYLRKVTLPPLATPDTATRSRP